MKTNRKRKSAAIAGYYIERVGRRVVLSRGQVGAWETISSNADAQRIKSAGFNLESSEVQAVLTDPRRPVKR